MMRMVIITLIVLQNLGCEMNNKIYTASNSIVSKKDISIEDIYIDSAHYIWHSDAVQLYLDNHKVNISFTPQCIYSFSASLRKDKIYFYWDKMADCLYDRGLSKQFEGVVSPKAGDKFASIELMDRRHLKICYFYSEWVNEMNNHTKDVDTLFPEIFKLKYEL
jgi:hypothetical protein